MAKLQKLSNDFFCFSFGLCYRKLWNIKLKYALPCKIELKSDSRRNYGKSHANSVRLPKNVGIIFIFWMSYNQYVYMTMVMISIHFGKLSCHFGLVYRTIRTKITQQIASCSMFLFFLLLFHDIRFTYKINSEPRTFVVIYDENIYGECILISTAIFDIYFRR